MRQAHAYIISTCNAIYIAQSHTYACVHTHTLTTTRTLSSFGAISQTPSASNGMQWRAIWLMRLDRRAAWSVIGIKMRFFDRQRRPHNRCTSRFHPVGGCLAPTNHIHFVFCQPIVSSQYSCFGRFERYLLVENMSAVFRHAEHKLFLNIF